MTTILNAAARLRAADESINVNHVWAQLKKMGFKSRFARYGESMRDFEPGAAAVRKGIDGIISYDEEKDGFKVGYWITKNGKRIEASGNKRISCKDWADVLKAMQGLQAKINSL